MAGPRPGRRLLPVLLRAACLAFVVVVVVVNVRGVAMLREGGAVARAPPSPGQVARGREAVASPAASAAPHNPVEPSASEAVAPSVAASQVATPPARADNSSAVTPSGSPSVSPRPAVRRRQIRRKDGVDLPPPLFLGPAKGWDVPTGSRVSVDTSSLTAFIASGGTLPILMVTRDRTDVLNATLSSLLSVRGVAREALFVVQDGRHLGTEAVLTAYGVRFLQKVEPAKVTQKFGSPQDIGAERIAQHFKFALEHMFDLVTNVGPRVCTHALWLHPKAACVCVCVFGRGCV